jgi:TIR domain
MTIFISYSRLDSEFVDRLVHELEERGVDAWADAHDSSGGSAWRASTSLAMRRCQAVIVVLSPRFAASDNAAKELSIADHYKRPIIPMEFTHSGLSEAADEVVRALRALPPPALPGGPRAEKPIEPMPVASQDRSSTRSRERKRHWLLGTVLVTLGLVFGLNQAGVFHWRDLRAGGAQNRTSRSAHSAAELPVSLAINPEVTAGGAAYRVLGAQVDSEKQTLRSSIRVTVGKDSNGLTVHRDFFRLLADGLTLAPTKYPDELLPPQTAKDFDLEFVMPKAATQVSLQVGDVKGQTAKIPIDLKNKSTTVFISYSRRDTEFADRLIHELEERGFDVWVDRQDIRGGSSWRASISQAMRQCQAVILILSPRSAASENVAKELSLADHHKRPIIPVSLEPSTIPAALEFQLAGLQIIEFNQAGFSDSMDKVVEALRALSPYSLQAGFGVDEQGAPIRSATQEKSTAGSGERQPYWFLGAILVAFVLLIGLKQGGVFEQMGVVDWREPHTGTSRALNSAAEPAASLGTNPDANDEAAVYKVLTIQVNHRRPEKQPFAFRFE